MPSHTSALAFVGAISRLSYEAFAELVAPSGCAACDAPLGPRVLFCPSCVVSVDRARPLPGNARGLLAAFDYGGAIATAIARFKYQDRPDLARPLGRSMLGVAASVVGRLDLVVPVPLHPRRLSERGYNQAGLLASVVGRELGIPFAATAIERVRDTPRQAELDRATRLANLAGAFSSHHRRVQDLRVLLVDDVATTGATLREAARSLRAGGAREVTPLVLAHRGDTNPYHFENRE